VYDSEIAFVQALSSVGLAYVQDLNTGIDFGAKRCTLLIKNGERSSAYDAYYSPIQGRSNLNIITYGQVQRINHGGKAGNLTAVGVTYTDLNLGMTMNVTAR